MQVILTKNGENDLFSIYQYHKEYSVDYAEKFHREIIAFMNEKLAQFPELGREFNDATGIRKLTYNRTCNIYYITRDDITFILYILDGRTILNDQILFLDDKDIESIT